jgi:hypothetical protein
MGEYLIYVYHGIWLVCGLIVSWCEAKKADRDERDRLEWKDILINTLLGPIKLYCMIIAWML